MSTHTPIGNPGIEEAPTIRGWLTDFGSELGCQHLETSLLQVAEEGFARMQKEPNTIEDYIEFSFAARGNTLRYAFDARPLAADTVETIMATGFAAMGLMANAGNNGLSRFDKVLMILRDDFSKSIPDALGVEHDANGFISRLKTYWELPLPPERLQCFATANNESTFNFMARAVKSNWPGWKYARGIGIDFRREGGTRFKVYLPQSGYQRPLTLEQFASFLLSLHWDVKIDTFPIMAHFILQGETEIAPSAYSFAICMDDLPSIKLGIVTQPYCCDTSRALHAILGIGEILNINNALQVSTIEGFIKHSPCGRNPRIETISIDFYPNSNCDMTVYCRL